MPLLAQFLFATIFVLIAATFNLTQGARILVILPVPLRDHQIVYRPLVESLAKRGHNLTIVTTDPENFVNLTSASSVTNGGSVHPKQVELIDLSFAHELSVLNMLKNQENMMSGSDMMLTVFHVMRTVAVAELKSPQMQGLLMSNNTVRRHQRRLSNAHNNGNRDREGEYDAVLVDWSGPALMNAFAHKFKAPLIGITPGGAYITSHEVIGNPNHPVAFPSIFMPFSEDLSLFQRVASTIFTLKSRYLYFNEELPKQDEIVKKFFGPGTPSIWEIESNADLLLVNCYQALGNARPVGPTTIHMGGIHAIEDKSLPWHLQHFLESQANINAGADGGGAVGSSSGSGNGGGSIGGNNIVAYINLGAMLTRAFVESHRMEKLVKILEKSSFDVVLNTNGIGDGYALNTTTRMYQGSDFEQESLLAHENVKLFITPGGQRDIEDAIHHKVPILGISFSSNLEHYLLQIIKHDAGLVSNFDMESSAELLAKIEAFAITQRYQKNINKLHKILTDEPMRPVERAVWWIEYVLRNNGTQHLRHSWVKLSWVQYLLLDVVLAVSLITCAFIFAVVWTCIRIRRYSKSLPFEKVTRRTKAKMM
ncbi:UDP-glucosyltransferase 2-like [Eupeodes corollae]|uniref:UDP-glucosyltransferase 2-like n=1 Tax=Eupeodes corollae TaxID=290404 RepID=UPI0024910C9A|nr:UDP-glucosyltransferase 2-like [Eupeodes corollae]